MKLFKNSVLLRGFLGSDAEGPVSDETRGDSCAVLTICLPFSYWKRQTSELITRTERHRVICTGAYFCGYTRGMKRGDYVEIEGELRATDSGSEVHALNIRRLECPPAGIDFGDDEG
jgi:hypothetical protein